MSDSQDGVISKGLDSDRKSRLTIHRPTNVQTLRERAASQPPRSGDPLLPTSSPLNRSFDRYNALWSQSPRFSTSNRSTSLGMPQSVPTRSSSFSNDHAFNQSGGFSSFRNNAFSSTFEDDESEILSDDTGPYTQDSFQDFPNYRRPYSPDTSRNRSQSLAGIRNTQRRNIGFSIPEIPDVPQSWNDPSPFLSETWRRPPVRSQVSDYLPRSSRALPTGRTTLSAISPLRPSGFPQEVPDISNVSPFLRDVNQIFDEGSGMEQWGGDEGWHPGSGTTSRRHSVSVVQPRRGALGLQTDYEPDVQNYAIRGSQSIRNEGLDIAQGLNALRLSGPDLFASDTRNASSFSGQSNPSLEFDGRSAPLSLNAHDSIRSHEGADMTSPRSPDSVSSSQFRSKYEIHPPSNEFGASHPQSTLSELGKGIPLRAIPSTCPLYIVEFKAGRTDLFYSLEPSSVFAIGDLVIVEADRGQDLGKVINDSITASEVEEWQNNVSQNASDPIGSSVEGSSSKHLNPKRIYSKASSRDTHLLITKGQDEEKALHLCQSKVQQKRLPMEVIDAEYQWDRRKLTFYFVAEKRIDFRELVRELFRLYKTRIWMASLSQTNFQE